MPNKLYKFDFSPPARLAWLAAKIYNVPTEIIDVDLSKFEQFNSEFLKVNPNHEVPAFDHDGKYVSQSREIAKYFHENFNTEKEKNDHWYPSDSEEREKVQDWLNWSDKRHMTICKPALVHGITFYGGPWRDNYGILMAVMGSAFKNSSSEKAKLMQCLQDGEKLLSERTIKEVEDLNLGDLAAYFEVSLPFAHHPDAQIDDYPNFKNLYLVLQKLPEFQEIDEAFRKFNSRIEELRENAPSPTVASYFKETWLTMKFIGTAATRKMFS